MYTLNENVESENQQKTKNHNAKDHSQIRDANAQTPERRTEQTTQTNNSQ